MAPVSKLDLLKNRRLVCVDQIDRIQEFVDNPEVLSAATVESLQLRQKTLEKIFSTFDSIQSKIEEQGYDVDTARIRATIEEEYYRIHPELSKQILNRQPKLSRQSISANQQAGSSFAVPQAAVPENPVQGLKLPKLSVPIFSGDPTKWLAFNDSFNSLIHRNTSISNSAKFQYLISSLSGPAAMIIESVEICDNNYPVALKLLCDRYDNRKLIAQDHIHKLFDAKAVGKNSLEDLRNLIDATRAHLRALETLQRPVKQWDDLIVHLITSKLDNHSLAKWQENSAPDRLSTLEELFNFLNKRCQVLQNSAPTSSSTTVVRQSTSSSTRVKQSTSLVSNAAVTRCIYCDADKHSIYGCDKFKKLPIGERLTQIKKRHSCINCLRSGHYVEDCNSEGCRTCQGKHHTLLHFQTNSQSYKPPPPTNNQNNQVSSTTIGSSPTTSTSLQSTAAVQAQGSEYIFLSTASVNVMDNRRVAHTCRVLLDSGSQLSFVTEQLIHQLGLSRFKANIGVTGVAGSETTIKHKSLVTIQSKITSFSADLEVFILPKITEYQPNRIIDSSSWKFPSHIHLADPSFNVPQRIDILIGAELCYNLLSVGQIQSTKGRPMLQNSVLGWLLAGKSQSLPSSDFECLVSSQATIPLDRQVEQFWELEQIEPSRALKSTEEEEAERHYCAHVTRNRDGRYVVSLPFKNDPHSLGNSQFIATRRFYTIERKLLRNPQLHLQYAVFMSEYLSLGHMEQINSSSIPKSNYFLPHHCVLNYKFVMKTLRVIAYDNRFISNIRASIQHKEKSTESLTTSEIETSLMSCIKIIQATAFLNEIAVLSKNKEINRRSSIATLIPFLDTTGILRVGGRLRNADLPFSVKHPILLPKSHSFITALMNYYHIKHFHTGAQALLAVVRQRFWPVNGKELSRKIVKRCIRCFKSKPATISQLMGDLPEHRVTPGRPFICTGIDFIGPIHIHYKIRGKRPTKAYIAMFICFATKAVHLEPVSDLSSEAFLAALKRFIGRRGIPQKIYTDNATNFVGAKNILDDFAKLFHSQITQNKIHQVCTNEGIQWCTIPPRSPHFGGLWEAGVKSAKFHLYRQLGLTSLTFEELSTVLVRIEAILNSRPLTPLSSDPNDLAALTAGHFLIGAPLTAIVEPDVADQNLDQLSRWRRISWLHQQFWRRWSKDYLHTLQNRTKWQQVAQNIKTNTLVLLQDENLPPLKWSLGRVTELHTGKDGLVRVVTVQARGGQFKRAITKLAVLPLTTI